MDSHGAEDPDPWNFPMNSHRAEDPDPFDPWNFSMYSHRAEDPDPWNFPMDSHGAEDPDLWIFPMESHRAYKYKFLVGSDPALIRWMDPEPLKNQPDPQPWIPASFLR